MRGTTSPSEAVADAAIARVLDAERAAREAVEEATREADRIVDRARAAAEAVGERAERRIRRIRAAFEAHADREIARLDAAAARETGVRDLDAEDMARLARGIDAVCDELTGRIRRVAIDRRRTRLRVADRRRTARPVSTPGGGACRRRGCADDRRGAAHELAGARRRGVQLDAGRMAAGGRMGRHACRLAAEGA
jgi:vacuolar-type H+-ATPase subunit H